ncbi:MAG: uridine kinase [Clostridia bacterium]|nr:uridine kinase [Clostridia bacterium]
MEKNKTAPEKRRDGYLTVGIAGGSGSGKTTLTNGLAARFHEKAALLRHDDYYKAHDDLTPEERAALNYDCPEAFDTDLLIEHIKTLRSGKPVESPIYDFTVHNRTDKTRTVNPAPVILVEGILIFADRELADLLDLKIFVETDPDVRLVRRIMRDVKRRERTLESVVEQYLSTVKPMYETYVEPSKKLADIIVPEGARNPAAFEMLADRIDKHIWRSGRFFETHAHGASKNNPIK